MLSMPYACGLKRISARCVRAGVPIVPYERPVDACLEKDDVASVRDRTHRTLIPSTITSSRLVLSRSLSFSFSLSSLSLSLSFDPDPGRALGVEAVGEGPDGDGLLGDVPLPLAGECLDSAVPGSFSLLRAGLTSQMPDSLMVCATSKVREVGLPAEEDADVNSSTKVMSD